MYQVTIKDFIMKKMILEVCSAGKLFPGAKALDDVSIDLWEGEAHVLMGENGAGKSTWMKSMDLAGFENIGSGLTINKEKGHSPVNARSVFFIDYAASAGVMTEPS